MLHDKFSPAIKIKLYELIENNIFPTIFLLKSKLVVNIPTKYKEWQKIS